MPKATFIIPVKDCEKFIGKTIDSILAQTIKDFEIIVVNDHSQDKTEEIICSLSRKDKRIISLNNTGRPGAGSARNFGLKQAKGDVIVPNDADDPSFPKRLEISLSELEKKTADIFYGNLTRYDQDTKKEEDRHFQNFDGKMLRYINIVCHGASAYKREVFEKTGGYDEDFAIGEDYSMFLKAQELGFKFTSKNIPVARYTMRSGQLTSQNDPERIKKRQHWNRLIREKHKIYDIDFEYVKKHASPEVIEFYVNKNFEIWFGKDSIPEKN